MSGRSDSYAQSIRHELRKALCIQCFPSQTVERHNKPAVEIWDSPELLLPHVEICKSDQEKCLIEPSINSVRVSFVLRAADRLEQALLSMYTSFLMQRADQMDILRRVPVSGYDISFLITEDHYMKLDVDHVITFISEFAEEMDKERNQLKLAVNTRARAIACKHIRQLTC